MLLAPAAPGSLLTSGCSHGGPPVRGAMSPEAPRTGGGNRWEEVGGGMQEVGGRRWEVAISGHGDFGGRPPPGHNFPKSTKSQSPPPKNRLIKYKNKGNVAPEPHGPTGPPPPRVRPGPDGFRRKGRRSIKMHTKKCIPPLLLDVDHHVDHHGPSRIAVHDVLRQFYDSPLLLRIVRSADPIH